jgi:hypothetical protein
MSLIDRIGIDIGIKHSVEDGRRWAATLGSTMSISGWIRARRRLAPSHRNAVRPCVPKRKPPG